MVIPPSIVRVGGWAFIDCSNITSLTFTESNDIFGVGVFGGCNNIKELNIVTQKDHKTDTYINYEALEKLTLTGNGKVEGFGLSNKLTWAYIGNEIEFIENSAFWGCEELIHVTIGDGVTEISYSAFKNCTGLESIVFGENVKYIYYDAFNNCTNLKTVYYKGTPENWEKINYQNPSVIQEAKVYFYSE